MDKVSDAFAVLYHYTTYNGLIGILKSNSLWATHYKYLNDYSEIDLFRDKLVELSQPHIVCAFESLANGDPKIRSAIEQAGGVRMVAEHDARAFVDAQYHATGQEIYIASFCGPHSDAEVNDNGLLSQWRGYGAGGGFALVFDTKKVEELLEIEHQTHQYDSVHIADVVYNDDEENLKREFDADLKILADDLKLAFDPDTRRLRRGEDLLQGYRSFVLCVTRYKHLGFKEEREIRIVALPTNLKSLSEAFNSGEPPSLLPEKPREYREINGERIPYIELFGSLGKDLPIKKIIVGPHREKERRAAALRTMLRNVNIEVTCSNIPYA